MNRDEAIAYIQAHPDTFRGDSTDSILGKIQSTNDPDFYDPTLYVPEQTKTIPRKQAQSVSYKSNKSPAKPALAMPAATQGLFSNVHMPALPVALAIGLLALGAGMAVYRASR